MCENSCCDRAFLFMAINSCDLIGDSVCVVDKMIFKKIKINMTFCFGAEQGSEGRFRLSQKLPPFCELFQR